jgi:general secretion pathway protein A
MDAVADNAAQYWGLAVSPFSSLCDARWFYQSATHEEAVSRLMYTADERRRLAVLTGGRGLGKSLILHVFGQSLARIGADVCHLSLAGRDRDEFAWQLACELKLAVATDTPGRELWARIQDHLEGRRATHAPLVLLCDDLGVAGASLAGVERLLRAEELSRAVTFVLAGRPGDLHSSLLDLADVRVTLEPLALRETHEYVQQLLSAAGAERTIFQHEALDELHELSGGVPREINRVAELALLAGCLEQLDSLSDQVVRAAAIEARVELATRVSRYAASA